MKKILGFGLLALLSLTLWLNCGSSSSTSSNSIPLVTPPVKAATPVGLNGGDTSLSTNMLLSTNDFNDRFFTTGPTSIFRLLTAMDDLITEANTLSDGSTSTCLTQEPVAYDITPYGQTVTMYGQCYTLGTPSSANDPSLFQFGIKDDVTYIYAAKGAQRIAAIVTPIVGETDQYSVRSWIGVGYVNGDSGAWDAMSYGVMQLKANSSTKAFELSVAGIGFGYCGLQMVSDGTNLSAEGSGDMGTTCNVADTLCVKAIDGTTTGNCSALSFTLPAFGRESVTAGTNGAGNNSGESEYPVTPNISLTGAADDDLHFGPETRTAGLGLLE